jgi:S-formylglutathione hydrolase FrmB
MLYKITFTLLIILSLANFGLADTTRYVVKTKYLNQKDTVLVFTPSNYSDHKSYPLVYLLHGFSENYDQWSNATNLQFLADEYGFVFVCPDGYRSWYINSPVADSSQYESFFFEELKPLIHRNYNVDTSNVYISGLSMGGYGAFQLFASKPDYFKSFGSTSGVIVFDEDFDYSSYLFFKSDYMVEELGKVLGDKLHWKQHDVYGVINKIINSGKPFIFDCGYDDPFFEMNDRLKNFLKEKGANASFIGRPGSHNNNYWGKSIISHLQFFESLMEENTNKYLKRQVIRYFEKIDASEFDETYYDLFSEDVELYFPKFGFAHGTSGLKLFSKTMSRHLKSLDHDIENFNIIQSGRTVIVEGTETGETTNGVKWPDNNVSHGKFCNVFEFEGELIKRVHIYVDPDYASEDQERINVFKN